MVDTRFLRRWRDGLHAHKKVEIFRYGERWIERILLWDERAKPLNGSQVRREREPVNLNATRLHGEQASQYRNQRRLSRSIRSEQAEQASGFDRETDVVQRGSTVSSVAERNVTQLDHFVLRLLAHEKRLADADVVGLVDDA